MNKQSKFSFALCPHVAIMTAAIAFSVNAQALTIGRLPSTSGGGNQTIGPKPNLFLVIDNGIDMRSDGNGHYTQYGNLLQQAAAGLIAALPALEGKVRIGYTTTVPGIIGGERLRPSWSCRDYKLNGNITKIVAHHTNASDPLSKIASDIAANKNYIFLKKSAGGYQDVDDFVFSKGSGYGEIAPRDFSNNYARYLYAWLGAMCPGTTAEVKYSRLGFVKDHKSPPYAPLANDTQSIQTYRGKAAEYQNPDSLPLRNAIANFLPSKARPLADAYGLILGQVADKNYLYSIYRCKNERRCGMIDLTNDPLRDFGGYNFNTKYDAYSDTSDATDGFPTTTDPKSCRKNYTIIISQGEYSTPDSGLSYNQDVGVNTLIPGGYGWTWQLPGMADGLPTNQQGFHVSQFPKDADYTRIYRHLPGNAKKGGQTIANLVPFIIDIHGGGTQGVNGRFLFSKLALSSYYADLRSDLPNNVRSYYAVKQDRTVAPNVTIPKVWDRKNDPANWQNMTLFVLGFRDGYPLWKLVGDKYRQNYDNIDSSGGILEPYFRAIEDGSIYASNAPVFDFSRGQFGTKENGGETYNFKDRNGNISPFNLDPHDVYKSQLPEMDFAKAGISARGGTFEITNYDSIKNVVSQISNRIQKAMVSAVSGGAIGGGNRITGSMQAAGGTNSVLFTTYLNEVDVSGNLFAFKNCPLIKQKIIDSSGNLVTNPQWIAANCGERLWNTATALNNDPNALTEKTIVPVKGNKGQLVGKIFKWGNLDADLQHALQGSDSADVAQDRVKWINGALRKDLGAAAQKVLRVHPNVEIPRENQRYKLDKNGQIVKDNNGNVILADATSIPNRMGEIVYAAPKAVENRGTLNAASPLNDDAYYQFIQNTVSKREPMVLTGSNDGRLYGFVNPGATGYPTLAFSYIPRAVIADGRLRETTESSYSADNAKSLVNGPFSVMDAKVGGEWGTYVVGTLGAGGGTVYALDISDGTAKFKWEVNLTALKKADGSTVNLGNANIMAEPRVVWLRKPQSKSCSGQESCVDGKWVVLLPSGYNSTQTALLILDLADGHLISSIQTGARYSVSSAAAKKDGILTCELSPLLKGSSENLNAIRQHLDQTLQLSNKGDSRISCDNGLSPLTVVDEDSDGGADYVYAGDLMGHVWKFDLTGFYDSHSGEQSTDLSSALKVSYNSPLFIAQTAGNQESSTRQPITTQIELDEGPNGEGSLMYFGTGRLFNQEERNLDQQQSFYAVWDMPRYAEQKLTQFTLPLRRTPSLSSDYGFLNYETFNIANSQIASNNSWLKERNGLRGVRRVDSLSSADYLSCNLKNQCNTSGGQVKAAGWILDFPNGSSSQNSVPERVINSSRTFENGIYFSTFTPTKGAGSVETCQTEIKQSAGGIGRFYTLNRLTGAQLRFSPFDTNGDGVRDSKDGVKVSSEQYSDKDSSQTVNLPKDNENNYLVSPAGFITGSGDAGFVSLQGIPASGQTTAECDFERQIIFPGTVNPNTGNPLTLTGCYRNRNQVWKQPILE